jgi:hypothetical protein
MGKLAFILGVPVALLASVASLGIVVVDVNEGGPRGHHVVVPLPLVLAQAAVAISPAIADQKLQIPDPEALRGMKVARGVLEALAKGPDGELVRVEDHREQVVITKQGRTLHVHVQNAKENVTVNVPLHLALSALPGEDGQIRMGSLAAALGGVRFTDLVEVRDGDDRVRIYVW